MSGKSEAFKRLANARVNKVLNDLRLIGNLSNRGNYEYSGEEVDAIFVALKSGIANCRKRFDISASEEGGFKLG